MLISAVQHSDSIIHISFHILDDKDVYIKARTSWGKKKMKTKDQNLKAGKLIDDLNLYQLCLCFK